MLSHRLSDRCSPALVDGVGGRKQKSKRLVVDDAGVVSEAQLRAKAKRMMICQNGSGEGCAADVRLLS
jgi:hypothetical protein